MIIGRISEVKGTRVVGIFYEKLPPHLIEKSEVITAPQINSYVKTRVGLDIVVCQIVGENEIEYYKQNTSRQNYEESDEMFLVDLEVRGRIAGGKFFGGLRCLPIVGARIETLSMDDYKSLFSTTEKAINVGRNLFDTNITVRLNINKLIPSHIGIFGNTGSGKSNTLARLLKEYISVIPKGADNAKVLIFDLNNEYGGNAIIYIEQKHLYALTTRKNDGDKIPLDFSQLTEDNWGTILRATQKTQMPVVRRAYKKSISNEPTDYNTEIKRMLVNKRVQMFFTLREYGAEFFKGIEEISYNKTTEGFYYNTERGNDYIKSLSDCRDTSVMSNITDNLDRFILELLFEIARSSESGTNFEYIQPLLPRARAAVKDLKKTFEHKKDAHISSIFNKKLLTIVQLGNVNAGTRETIPSLLSELIFQNAINSRENEKTKSIISIVIDEAHNLLAFDSESNDLLHDNTLRVFEKVIKEGRKFGVFLYLASQRPSDISGTITSQIHNFFIHKLVNPNDIERIRKTVSFMGDSSLLMLSALGQGECIISGPSLYMPQYVYVDELSAGSKPNSIDLALFGEQGIFARK